MEKLLGKLHLYIYADGRMPRALPVSGTICFCVFIDEVHLNLIKQIKVFCSTEIAH